MEPSEVLAYKFPDDEINKLVEISFEFSRSDESSSSSSNSSGSSTISKKLKASKCKMNSEKALSTQDRIVSVINRLQNNVTLGRKNSQGDEFSSRSRSSSDSKENEDENEEREESIPADCEELNYIEDEDVESNDGSTILQFCQLGPTATSEDIAVWLRYNNFGNFVDIFEGFNYYDFRRLNRNDFIEMCGTVKGIQIFNAMQMKPVRPLRTIYCALESPNNNGMNWQPVYLHCLNAIELNAEIVARFKLSTRKHSFWMEGPYGINIIVNNEAVEYLEDNDMFLIRIVENPSVDNYKIILRKYM